MGKLAGGGSVSAPTIDTAAFTSAFLSGAEAIESQFPNALVKAEIGLGLGQRELIDSFTQSNILSLPFSETALAATDELRSFLGLAPTSKTAGLHQELTAVADQFRTAPFSQVSSFNNVAGLIDNLSTRLELAENSPNLAERSSVKTEILQEFQDIQEGIKHDMNVWFNANTGQSPDFQQIDIQPARLAGITGLDRAAAKYGEQQLQAGNLTSQDAMDREKVVAGLDFLESAVPDLTNLATKFDAGFSEEPLQAKSSEEITAELENLPEFQFQFEQGQKALERSQAAKGELSSGRALQEATEFGQDLAQNVYQGHLSRLAGLAGMNLPVAQQGIASAQQQGQALFQSAAAGGSLQQRSLQDVARARQSAFNAQGQGLVQTGIAQAQMQLQADQFNAQQSASAASGFGQIAGSLLGGLF